MNWYQYRSMHIYEYVYTYIQYVYTYIQHDAADRKVSERV